MLGSTTLREWDKCPSHVPVSPAASYPALLGGWWRPSALQGLAIRTIPKADHCLDTLLEARLNLSSLLLCWRQGHLIEVSWHLSWRTRFHLQQLQALHQTTCSLKWAYRTLLGRIHLTAYFCCSMSFWSRFVVYLLKVVEKDCFQLQTCLRRASDWGS